MYTEEEIREYIWDFYEEERSIYSSEFENHPDFPTRGPVDRIFGNWGTALNELGIPNPHVECPDCGLYFLLLSKHWDSSECNFPKISGKQHEILTGLLMGDGTVSHEREMPYLMVSMITKTFLHWLSRKMGVLGGDVRFKTSSEEAALHIRETGFSPETEPGDCSDSYVWQTRGHPGFQRYADWYSTGQKRFPDIELTPLILKVWYCCDGSMQNNKTARRICIGCSNESDREDFLYKMFEEIGVDVRFDRGEYDDGSQKLTLYFSSDDSKYLWDYMGDPLPGFEYKWPNFK